MTSRLRKSLWVHWDFIGLLVLDSRTYVTQELHKAVQQGRHKPREEAYASVR
jgi:hypothetical protein